MSTFLPLSCKCAVCGASSQQTVVASTNSFGLADLDLRPSEMARSTMPHWIQECPSCGYISSRIENPKKKISKEWLIKTEFITCSNVDFISNLAKKFYKYYLINIENGDIEDAFYAVLNAAWACDDAKDIENARRCRGLAIVEIEKLIENDKENEELQVQKADLLRRAGRFETLIQEYTGKSFSDDMLQKIINFQLNKAKQGDMNCYTVDDIERKIIF